MVSLGERGLAGAGWPRVNNTSSSVFSGKMPSATTEFAVSGN